MSRSLEILRRKCRLLAAVLPLAASCPEVSAQPTFSIDSSSPTMLIGVNFFGGGPIFEGDILSAPFPGPPLGAPTPGPFPPGIFPGVVINGGPPFIGAPAGLGLVFGVAFMEVDALSYGNDPLLGPGMLPPGRIYFSVDEFAVGLPGPPPSVFTEGAMGFGQASADVFANLGAVFLPPAFALPPPGFGANIRIIDGNGVSFPAGLPLPGLALIEPNFPLPGVPDLGDNLDALDMDTTPADLLGPVLFSMDSGYADLLEVLAAPPNTGTAAANGFVGGDIIIVAIPGVTPPALFAPAAALGLDLAGPDTDDIDALVVSLNAIPGYQPSMVPYDWMTGATDMVLISARRLSGVIGTPDSRWGILIEEGDILTTPFLGLPGAPPAIFIMAEQLGLATVRSGTAGPSLMGDDLDALDIVLDPGVLGPLFDCNGNGALDVIEIATGAAADCNSNSVPDSCDLAFGTSPDCNASGVPDECELAAGDCDGNSALDVCEIASCPDLDCNGNGVPDSCDIAPLEFAAAVPNATDYSDDKVLAADLDGDGDTDLVVSSDAATFMMTLFNAGDGTYGTAVNVAAGAGQSSIAAADLDGDGDVDLVATNQAVDTVTVLINDGSGAFAAPAGYAVGDYPYSVAAADFDGDGDPDLAVANLLSDTVSVLANTGSGTFAAAASYASFGGPIAVAAADLDGDGDVDLATANRFASSVSVLLNTGGLFAPLPAFTGGDGPFAIVAADLDGDGDNDLATADYDTAAATVHLNAGGAVFAPAVSYPAIGAWSIATADPDGDGDLDLVGPEALLRNNGNGTFGTMVPLTTGPGQRSAAAADLDGDGDEDVAIVAGGPPLVGVWVLINTGVPVSTDADGNGVPDECDAAGVVITDCNSNGVPDACDVSAGTSPDCNGNGVPDECDCTGDANGDGSVGVVDFLLVLAAWGSAAGGPADFDCDGTVGVVDLLLLLANWGLCP